MVFPLFKRVPRCFPHMHVLRLSFLRLSQPPTHTSLFANNLFVLVKSLQVIIHLHSVAPQSRTYLKADWNYPPHGMRIEDPKSDREPRGSSKFEKAIL